MKKQPQVSVIIPVYNVVEFIDDCLRSVVGQSFIDTEIIIVDDGSSDGSGDVCDKYMQMDSRIKIIHKKNGGISSARNTGLDIASGKYIVFVDSDDILPLDAIKTLHHELEDSNAEIVLSKIKRFTSLGEERFYSRLNIRKTMTGEEALSLILEGKEINISVCGVGYKKSVFDRLRFPMGMICEDWYVMPDIYLNTKKVVFIPETCYLYRENANSIMGQMMKKANLQVIDVAERVIKRIEKDNSQLYLSTLWSNMKRVWKYVGFAYCTDSLGKNSQFLECAKQFFLRYAHDLRKSAKLRKSEYIGLWTFCYMPIACRVLYSIKYKKLIKAK